MNKSPRGRGTPKKQLLDSSVNIKTLVSLFNKMHTHTYCTCMSVKYSSTGTCSHNMNMHACLLRMHERSVHM